VTAGDTEPRAAVPAVVAPIADAAGPHVAGLVAAVESRLRDVAGPGEEAVDLAGTAAVAAGGKRLRPLLAIVVAGAAAGDDDERARAAVRAGVALELIHTATLAHDDVLDAAPLRRGRPTAFAEHGRAAATCLGDALFAAAFAELAAGGSTSAVQALAGACRELAQGELLQRADAWRTDVDEARYLERCRLKTGALFAAAATLGAQVGGVAPEPYARFATAIGVAFQLFDDVLDVVGPPEVTGKPRGTDLLDGTVTLPLLLARAEDPVLRELDLRALDPAGAAAACDRIAATGATVATERRARELVDVALAALPPDGDAGRDRALRLIGRGVVDRRL
jgi:octaprenyl-diphosphate synthase